MNTKCFVRLLYALFILFICLFYKEVKSQNRFYNSKYHESNWLVEFGIGAGGMNCLTDLGGNAGIGENFFKDVNLTNTNFCKSFSAGVLFKDVVGVRIEATFGDVNSYDSILKPVATSTYGRYDRNLNFRSSIAEITLIGELHPIMLLNFQDKSLPRFSPYLLAGIGNFSFNPQAYFRGAWVNLQPLHLEGQGFKEYPNRPPYSLNAICYPVGFGIKYEISNWFIARFECIYRFTNTDYLDDASQEEYIKPELFSKYLNTKNADLAKQLYDRHKELNPSYVLYPGQIRGNSNNNDAYFSIELKIGITLGRQLRK